MVDEGERIVHVLSMPLEPGAPVHGAIDAARRLDHMQQHTGQHILSAAFDRLFASQTVSFHLGSGDVHDRPGQAAVGRRRRTGRGRGQPRGVGGPPGGGALCQRRRGAGAAGLRKESQREGELRLVEVTDFDLSACGGTHVARTGAIGIIAVTGTEKVKGGLRVSFVCGRRALDQLRLLRDAVAGSLRALSVLPAELPDAIRRLQADGKALRKRAAELQVALAGQEADRLLALASPASRPPMVAAVMDGWDAGGLRAIASSLIARGPVQVVLATAEQPVSIVVAQSSATGVGRSGRGGAPDVAVRRPRRRQRGSWRRPAASTGPRKRSSTLRAACSRNGAGSREPEAGSR